MVRVFEGFFFVEVKRWRWRFRSFSGREFRFVSFLSLFFPLSSLLRLYSTYLVDGNEDVDADVPESDGVEALLPAGAAAAGGAVATRGRGRCRRLSLMPPPAKKKRN